MDWILGIPDRDDSMKGSKATEPGIIAGTAYTYDRSSGVGLQKVHLRSTTS